MFTAQIMDAENGILRRDMRSKWYRVGSLRGPSVLCGTESRCARDRTSSGSKLVLRIKLRLGKKWPDTHGTGRK